MADQMIDHLNGESSAKVRAGHIICKKTRRLKILKTVQRLYHACKCTIAQCQNEQCDELKSTVVHFKMCTRKPRKDCHCCRQLIAICRYHAKRSKDCESSECVIPFCAQIKHNLHMKKKKSERSQVEVSYVLHPNPIPTIDLEEEVPSEISDFIIDGTIAQEAQHEQIIPEMPSHTPYAPGTTENHGVTPEVTTAYWNRTPRPTESTIDAGSNREYLRKWFHAHRCLENETQGRMSWPCFEPHCARMKPLVQHVLQCQSGRNCQLVECIFSKKILCHWKYCTDTNCPICRSTSTQNNSLQFQDIRTEPSTSTANQVENLKEWQVNFSQQARTLIVSSLLKKIKTDFGITTQTEINLLESLTQSVHALEENSYHRANSKQEYFYMFKQYCYGLKELRILREIRQQKEQLREILQRPLTPTQQTRIIVFLKANPQLLATFIEERQRTNRSMNELPEST